MDELESCHIDDDVQHQVVDVFTEYLNAYTRDQGRSGWSGFGWTNININYVPEQ